MKTKICTKCNIEKPFSDFHKSISFKTDGVRSICKECLKQAGKEYRINNSKIIKAKAIIRKVEKKDQITKLQKESVIRMMNDPIRKEHAYNGTKRRRNAYKHKWREILKEFDYDKCIICGYDIDQSAIDFHHENPLDKTVDPTKIMNNKPTKERISLIITTTIPLCANCHRLYHHTTLLDEIIIK